MTCIAWALPPIMLLVGKYMLAPPVGTESRAEARAAPGGGGADGSAGSPPKPDMLVVAASGGGGMVLRAWANAFAAPCAAFCTSPACPAMLDTRSRRLPSPAAAG